MAQAPDATCCGVYQIAEIRAAGLQFDCLASQLNNGRRRPKRHLMGTQHQWVTTILVCALSGVAAGAQPTTSPVCHDSTSSTAATTRPATPNPAADAAFGRGVDAFRAGDYQRAAQEWRVSTEGYHQSSDWPRECESLRRLAGAYQMLGNYRLAMDILCPAREAARGRDDRQFMLFSASMGRTLCFTRSHHDPDGDPEPYLKEALT